MPFANAFERHPLIERMRRVRSDPIATYGFALLVIALATLVRWIVGGRIMEGLPFITYYPAIVLAALVGGFWPGMLATASSAAIAWYLFMPPFLGWEPNQREVISLLLFLIASGVNVILVALLNAVVERVMAQEQNVHVLIESAPNGIIVMNKKGQIELVNVGTENLFGYQRPELVGRTIDVLVPDRHVAAHALLREEFLQKPEARPMGAGRDLTGRRKDGSEFPVEIGLNPIGGNAVLATVINISERKRLEESQQLIIRELQHRTQNIFAVFQSIASRTLDNASTTAEAKNVLNGRLQALSRAYAMLAETWQGVSVSALLDRQFAGFPERIHVSGCEIVVSPSAAQQFALIIHELTTNALKYGALSAPDGQVSIEGKIEGCDGSGLFSFVWKESGGPPVSPPTRKGFGSVILFDVARQFGQNAAVNYAPLGLSYELQLRLSDIEVARKVEAGTAAAHLLDRL